MSKQREGKSQHNVITITVWSVDSFEIVLSFHEVNELYFLTASILIDEYGIQTLDQRNLALPTSEC